MIHLTGQNYNSRDIIQNIFSPLIGVLSSSYADEVCHRNNLSFAELLMPFAKLQNEAHFRDASGTSVSMRGLRLNFCDIDWRPPQTVLARKMLNESTNVFNDKTKIIHLGDISLELPTSEPWFENWRETFLTVQYTADHEFTRNLLSCLIVLSSGDPNIVETAHKLSQRVHQMQSVTPQKLPKWFHSSDVLNSYVVLHEGTQGDLSKAQQGYELLKSTFGGSKCFLIQINSLDVNVTSGEVPDYWTSFLKRQPKNSDNQSGGSVGDKTPQDSVSGISMPPMQMSLLTDAITQNEASDIPNILHPLSPVQENATEAINSKFSISSESISQTINPNVWIGDFDAPHGQCLNAMDVENVRHFVQDYAVRALIPYIEHLVGILNEAVTNKKGVSKSLLSATKRWFVTKPGASASNQNAVIYTHESAELQTRKLGDLYFMFGHYNMAFQAYHQAKRDFNADSAWQYYAGALEMAALSAFMLGTANRKTYDYMEDAIVCYLNTCKLQQFATRATLLSVECLKTARLYNEAAKQLIRMTSEESDLRSALFLEQAAYCFLACSPAMYRTYAFQIILSGNRYSRAGQRKHAYRCYAQAYQVFEHKGWSLAEDHIQYTMAKQAYMLKKLEEASRSFAHLLRPGSLQNEHQQLSFLKEFIQTQNEYIKRHPEMGLLPHALPQIVQDSIKILTLSPPITSTAQYMPAANIDINTDLSDEPIWHKLEEMIVTTASAANKPQVFKPSRSLFTKENPTIDNPIAIQGEPIELAVTIANTIRCGIILKNVELLWRLKLDNDEELSNICLFESLGENLNSAAISAAVKCGAPQSVMLDEKASQTLYFKLTPKLTGRFTIVGMVAEVASQAEPIYSILGSLQFETQILRQTGNKSPAFDQKLNIRVIPTLPSLNISFSAIPSDLLAGEIVPVNISFRNDSNKPIQEILVGCDNPRWLALQDKDIAIPLSLLSSIKDLSNEKLIKDKEIRQQHVVRLFKSKKEGALKAQEGSVVTAWIQAPYEKGEFTLRLLFYYGFSSEGKSGNLKYRLVRHNWKLKVHEGLQSDVTCVLSNATTGELGINIDVRNENKIHHALMSELYINSFSLYCQKYKLNTDKLYWINQMEMSSGLLGDKCLKPSTNASFQCRLIESETANDNPLPQYLLTSRLSHMPIESQNVKYSEANIPKMSEMYSFLAKHETVFFNPSLTTEEFNNIVASYQTHTTIALCWTAAIVQNSMQRQAYGQHFIQLKNVFEKKSCPVQTDEVKQFKNYLDKEQQALWNIDQFYNKFPQYVHVWNAANNRTTECHMPFGEDDDDDFWEPNEIYVGQRCFLEDETFLISNKA
ncbi:trafficking protein particle complex subunit 8 homolog l(3)76BDm [Haematobia irritans]|uniref:trafficking protein particle complex subunit 8 homolog l(3)76BDm n=1 Tax=Haematobia irritans TaxID=7368 RepID=UPI003F506FFD